MICRHVPREDCKVKQGPSFEESWKVELRRGLLQYAVLAIVRLHEEGIHGYGIARELDERTDGLLEVKEGTLYPILHRLRKERLLNSHTEKSDAGPRRKVYVLTGEGDRVYRELSRTLGDVFEKLEALS
ncbi:PadR family transcriptional regulator [Candidatus Thorarchaeota archaeon]|nr:MAG: PadR family transcriptional regulator [Candidatus Thorarchaeota archaeon]